MKTTKIKEPKCYPHVKYHHRKKPYTLTARIFEDGGGMFEMKNNIGYQEYCEENGKLKDWIKLVDTKLNKLLILKEFLTKVKQLENK